MIDANAKTAFLCCRAAHSLMRAAGAGKIVNVGSMLSIFGTAYAPAYGASKAALRLYTEALRRELADSSVRIQYYAPRAIDTQFNTPDILAFNKATGSASDSPEVIAREIARMLRTESPLRFAG